MEVGEVKVRIGAESIAAKQQHSLVANNSLVSSPYCPNQICYNSCKKLGISIMRIWLG